MANAGATELAHKHGLVKLFGIISVILILAAVLLSPGFLGLVSPVVSIGETTVNVTVANTEKTRLLGLSGRQEMASDEGMLFVFDSEAVHCFWMKDMLFSIDIIWLDSKKRIIHTEKDVRPDTYPRIFCPREPARFVLEIHGGLVREHDIKIGQGAIFRGL